MKAARLFSLLGSVALVVSAIFHTSGYPKLLHLMQTSATPQPLDGILRAAWLLLSVQFLVTAGITMFARIMARGGAIVFLCAVYSGLTGILLWRFMGIFAGVYLLAVVTMFLLMGAWLQMKHSV